MIIVNLNIRGLGGGTKASYMRHIIDGRKLILSMYKKQSLKSSRMLDVLRFGGITKLVGSTIKEMKAVEVCCLCGIRKFLIMKVT